MTSAIERSNNSSQPCIHGYPSIDGVTSSLGILQATGGSEKMDWPRERQDVPVGQHHHEAKHLSHRVLVVISSLGRGGAERVTLDLCEYLRECGRNVTLLTLAGDDADAYPVPRGIRRERIEIRRPARSIMQSVRFTIQHLVAMRRKLLALRPDVVVSFIDQTNIRVLACLALTRIPVVVSERVHPGIHHIARPWRLARWLTYRFSRTVVVQTDEIANWFARWLDPHRITVIPNAVRRAQIVAPRVARSSEQTRQPCVLAAGRLTRQKGFDLLLDAFRRSRIVDLGWNLVILGEGPDRDVLKQRATALGIDRAVEMPGFVADVGTWLSRADLFALSSRYEGFPNALVEAMQCGRACISFDCLSGPSALIDHGRNGWLVPANDVDALADALRHLATDPSLRSRLGTEARKVGEALAPDNIYGRWVEVIDAAVIDRARNVSAPASLRATIRRKLKHG